MFQVVISPSHLAGAAVIEGIQDVENPGWVVLDKKHPTMPGNIAVAQVDIGFLPMSAEQMVEFRRIIGPCPEPPDADKALLQMGYFQ